MRTPITKAIFSDQTLNAVEHLSHVSYPRPAAWYWQLGSLLEPRFIQLGYSGQKVEALAAKFLGIILYGP
jgi:hypothetical protein